MKIKIITLAAVAVSILAGATVAEAGGKRKGFHKPHKGHYGHNQRHGYHNRHNWHGGYYYTSGNGCNYVFRKARRTGSPYWWNEYERCISRY